MDEALLFQQRVARLQSLLEASRHLHGTIQLEVIAPDLVRVVAKELEIPAVFLEPAAGSAIPEARYPKRATPLSAGRDGAAIWKAIEGKDGEALGRLGLGLQPGRSLDPEEENFLEGLLLQAGLALENALFHAERVRMERLSRDLTTARAIQEGLRPAIMPEVPGYAVAARAENCYEVGGDYLDIVPLSGDRLMLVVADVAGKGLASALVGSSFRAMLRAIAHSDLPLEEMAARLNDLHAGDGEVAQRKYVTCVLALLDAGSNSLELLNAGHPPALLSRGGHLRRVKSSGTPFGMIPGMAYRAERLEMEPGDTLLLYSDGITEAARGDDEFGDAGVEGVLAAGAEEAELLLTRLWAEVAAFAAGGEPTDDKTVLVLQRLPSVVVS